MSDNTSSQHSDKRVTTGLGSAVRVLEQRVIDYSSTESYPLQAGIWELVTVDFTAWYKLSDHRDDRAWAGRVPIEGTPIRANCSPERIYVERDMYLTVLNIDAVIFLRRVAFGHPDTK